jgi:hypothetical protein
VDPLPGGIYPRASEPEMLHSIESDDTRVLDQLSPEEIEDVTRICRLANRRRRDALVPLCYRSLDNGSCLYINNYTHLMFGVEFSGRKIGNLSWGQADGASNEFKQALGAVRRLLGSCWD